MKKVFILFLGITLICNLKAQIIQGIVKDANGNAQVGANVILKNSNKSTITDLKGNFSIANLDHKVYNLQISFIGKETYFKKLDLINRSLINLGVITLKDAGFKSDEVVVTATRTNRNLNTVPASVEYISKKDIATLPSQKADEYLKFLSGITVNRPFGIFGKSIVGIRGVVGSEPGRQLTLIDGVPINKSNGGETNWNRIINCDIEHIEVLKGPGASIYGNNAMGGTVNIITKRPYSKGVSTSAKLFYGTYNTIGAEANIMQKFTDKINGFYYSISAKYLKSDGYVTVPDSIRSKTDTAVFVKEKAINARFGYRFNDNTLIEFEYNFYNDNRGQGTVIKLDDGTTADYDTHFMKAKYTTKASGFLIKINGFYQIEKYLRTIEKLKRNNYTLINVNSDRVDYGILASVNKKVGKNNFILGVDYRVGTVYGVDNYKTSIDKVINKGNIDNVNIYLQDEIKFNTKLIAILGANFAYINFYNGEFKLENPTSATSYMKDYAKILETKQWNGFSPKLALQYNINKKINIYIVGAQGFRAASLDDLTRTGFINIGYKQANPNLMPETINNIEIGIRYNNTHWFIYANTYYSLGYNFMYYVSTGKTIFGGRKIVYEKQNISNVEIYGAELSVSYKINKFLSVNANYTYNSSKIKKFELKKDLEGKFLTYTPTNVVNLSTIIKNNKISSSINIKLQDKMFLDNENAFVVKPLFSADLRFSYNIWKGLGLGINIQNIFNEQHMVNSRQISLGRFISIEINYNF